MVVKMGSNVHNINWPYSGGTHNIDFTEIKGNLESKQFWIIHIDSQ